MSLNAKLILGALLVAAATAYLAYLGASSSWQYYVLVDECAANCEELAGKNLRVSGRVAPKSLQILPDRSRATFSLSGSSAQIRVSCRGPLPDNLAEDMDVVVEGTLEGGSTVHLQSDKVLTKCASKYQGIPQNSL
jgi:cytochrome c-type biogenesis protein CcmE